MSLELKNVEVRVRGKLQPITFRNIDLCVRPNQRIALLCPEPAAVTSLVAVIAGARAPDAGSVVRNSSISWPLPGGNFFHRHQTFVANARFIARLYERDQKSFIASVVELANLQDLAEHRMDRCPKDSYSRFSFALGACLPFDIYFFTSTTIGGKADRPKYAEIVSELGQKAGLIVASANGKTAQAYCDSAFVIDSKKTVYHDDIETAIEHLDSLKPKGESDAADDDDLFSGAEDLSFDDF